MPSAKPHSERLACVFCNCACVYNMLFKNNILCNHYWDSRIKKRRKKRKKQYHLYGCCLCVCANMPVKINESNCGSNMASTRKHESHTHTHTKHCHIVCTEISVSRPIRHANTITLPGATQNGRSFDRVVSATGPRAGHPKCARLRLQTGRVARY